ncbi:MAG: DUF1223 domain-containing protein [Acidobacteriota bacterium]|nr:DUF1223 domain-containing protein [Acidobacteriota bacterium]
MILAALVVVELFTSQGCSSCPPADALVSKLAQNRGQVIPLAFHVDYWDRQGWRDPFSSREWTARQMMYVHRFALNGAYTPQAVVNGSRQFVGSSASAMQAAIDAASRAKAVGSIALEFTRHGAKIDGSVRADAPPDSDVVLVLFQDGVTTKIERGENEGQTANDNAIVRRIVRVGSGAVTKNISIDADPDWKNLGIVAFVQNRTTLAITNAAVRYIQ